MAESLFRTGPLDGWAGRFAELPDSVTIMAEPFHAMVDVRLAPDGTGRPAPGLPGSVAAAVGTTPPEPGTWTDGEQAAAIWLGPDEWLVTSPFTPPAELEAAVRGPGGAAVDVSAQRTTIRLRGAHARDVLETGCAIDLHPRSFPAGAAAVTTLGQAGVVLLALDGAGTDYRILVRSSFAGYLAEWLIDAATEFRT
ncbi:MAG: sarcosine oxidase subunit gamma [Pseudonocardia sp.]|nr:sarcosine oxidase subunit gamma [Pseudonocardia sp.]